MIHQQDHVTQVVQGEFRVSSNPRETLSTILGSCVAACIWDPDDTFEAHCNLGMVDLEPVHPDGNEFLRLLISEHQHRTGSPVAAGILERWNEAADEFTVVIPPGFRAALAHTEPPPKARTVNLA